jgi:FtsH-binding integral membrane protein
MPTYEQKSLFSRQVSPIYQALMAFGGVLLFCILSSFFSMSNEKLTQQFPWMIAAAFMLVYALFNSVFWISAKNNSQYISQSVISYVGLAAASGLLAYAISGLKPSEAGSIKTIFIILTMGYVVFLAIMSTIKQLITFLNKEEQNKLEGKGRKKGKRKR